MSGTVSRISRLVGVEAQKVLGGKTLRFGVLAVAAVTLLTALTHEQVAEETAWTLCAAAFSAGLWAAEIFLLVAGTTAIAGETAQGTLKMILPHAYRRRDWIVAKGIILAAQAILLLLTALVVAVALGAMRGGLSDVTQTIEAAFGGEGRIEVLHSRGEMTGLLASSTGVALASLIATALVGLLISCLFDAVVPALSAGFLLFLGFKSAGALFGASPEFLSKIYASYPADMLTRVEKLGRGLSERWNPDLFGRGTMLAGVVALGCLVLAAVVFTRRDLQA